MPEPPADTIRRASQLMRERATAATPGPWATEWAGQQCQIQAPNSADGEPIAEWTYAIATWEPEVHQERAECQTGDAEHIAAMHPGVALAVAAWLDTWHPYGLTHETVADDWAEEYQHALAVSRTYLGETT